MKYGGTITILDDQGETVFERELTSDEMIAEILFGSRSNLETSRVGVIPAWSEKAKKRMSKTRKKGTCGSCNETGHNASTCPSKKNTGKVVKTNGTLKQNRACSICDKPGHNAKTCPQNTPANFGFKEKEEGAESPDEFVGGAT